MGAAAFACAIGSVWAGVVGMQGNASAAALCIVLMIAAVLCYVIGRLGGP